LIFLVNNYMRLMEMFDDDDMTGYQTEKDDNTVMRLNDLRKTKITLRQLNRLRIMNDVRKLEHEKDLEQVQNQYKAPAAQPPGL